MKHALGAALGLLLASAALLPAQAQDMADTRAYSLLVAGGVSFPQGDALEEMNTGWIGMAGIAFRPSAIPVGLRLEALYTRFGADEVSFSDGEGTISADGSTGIFGGSLNAIVGPSSTGTGLRPYLIGGVGVYNVALDFDIQVSGGGESADLSGSVDETAFGLNGGAGLEFSIGGLRSFVEARYHTIFTDFDDVAEDGDDSSMRTSFVPIVFGLRF